MKTTGMLLVVLAALLWGTDSLFRRPLTQSLSPQTIVFLEHVILVLVILPILARNRNELAKLNRKDWTSLVFIALGGSVIATVLFTFAIKFGNPSVTVLLQKTQPFFTIFLARWLLGERPGRWFWFLLAPILCGAYFVATPDWRAGLSIDPRQPACIVAALGASLLWGASTVFGRYIVARVPILILTGLRFALALPLLAVIYFLQAPDSRHLPSTFHSVSYVAVMALIPGLVAMICYYRGLQTTIASVASIGELAFPITAVLTNWFILGIRLTPSQFAGGAMLIAAVTALTYLHGKKTNPAR
jgi:drug/metabolite transporter (DMT)-like permease